MEAKELGRMDMMVVLIVRRWVRLAQCGAVAGLVLVICCVAHAGQPTTTQADWKARFLAEAPREWGKLETAMGQWQGSFDETNVSAGKTRSRQIRYWINGQAGGGKFEITREPDDGTEHVHGFNPRYDYEIGRDRLFQPMKLTKFARVEKDKGRDGDLVRRRNAVAVRRLKVAECLWTLNLRELIDGELGSLKSATPVEVGGHLRVRLDFDRWAKKTHEAYYPAWAVVDPALHWAVTAYEERDQTGATRGTVEYQPAIADVAFPKRITEEDVDPAGKVQTSKTWDFGKPEACGAMGKEFSLEAYGVAAPGEGKP